jgi:putative SOS response-associated peptidase YedK
MCGRYTLVDLDALCERFDVASATADVTPRYNAAPTQRLPVVLRGRAGRELRLLRWGLVPSWAKDEAIGHKLINARAETAAEKPSFRQAMSRRRCLVPASGFYEWQAGPGGKQPYYITVEGGLFAMAGLWESWGGAAAGRGDGVDGQRGSADSALRLDTFTILTVEPNALMAPIHNRMPAILRPVDEAAWLDPAVGALEAAALAKPYAAELMRAVPVGQAVGSPAHDAPDCIVPIQRLI